MSPDCIQRRTVIVPVWPVAPDKSGKGIFPGSRRNIWCLTYAYPAPEKLALPRNKNWQPNLAPPRHVKKIFVFKLIMLRKQLDDVALEGK